MDQQNASEMLVKRCPEVEYSPPCVDQSVSSVNSYLGGLNNKAPELNPQSQDEDIELLEDLADDETPLLLQKKFLAERGYNVTLRLCSGGFLVRKQVWIPLVLLIGLILAAAVAVPTILTLASGPPTTTAMETITSTTTKPTTTTSTATATTTATPVPPECTAAVNLTDLWRTNYSVNSPPGGGSHSSDGYACDFYRTEWFRFAGSAGVRMLDTCKVSSGSCGTRIPFWSDRTTPSAVGSPTTIRAFGAYHSCYSVFIKVSVMRCSLENPNDLIYKVIAPTDAHCSRAFCGMV